MALRGDPMGDSQVRRQSLPGLGVAQAHLIGAPLGDC